MYYDCNSHHDYVKISNAMLDASHHTNIAFSILNDFRERFMFEQNLNELKNAIEHTPEIILSQLYACEDQVRAAKIELDIFVNPDSLPLNFEFKLNRERQEIIGKYAHGGTSNGNTK